MLGFNLLPVFNAHKIEALERVKPILLLTGIFQRIPYLFAGLAIYYFGVKHPGVALWFVVLVPLLSGLFGGLISTAWQELVAKTVPNRRRASVFALRNIISSMIGITAGGIVAAVLNWIPGIRGYGILHLITFCFLALSYVVFVHIREGSYIRQTRNAKPGLRGNFREIGQIVRADRLLVRYAVTVSVVNAMFIMVPFLPIHALRVTKRPDSFLGFLVIAQMAGGILGNALAGYTGDRYGGRNVIFLGRVLLTIGTVWAAFAGASWMFIGIFFLQGWGSFSNMVGVQTMTIEFCPVEKRSTYLAIIATANVPFMLLCSLGGSWLWRATQNFTVLSLAAGSLLLLSLALLISIPEPRRSSSSRRMGAVLN